MGANTAGIYGAQIFRQEDKPRYRKGFSINIAVLAVGVSLVIVRFIDDRLRRRRSIKQVQTESAGEHIWQDEDKHPAARVSDVQPQTVLVDGNLKPVAIDPAK